jgi:hypothetical protein
MPFNETIMKRWTEQLKRMTVEYAHAKRTVKDEKKALALAAEELEACVEAQKILQGLALTVQRQASERIAGLVSSCLQTIFDEKLLFEINFVQRRGKTEADFTFKEGDIDITNPLSLGAPVDIGSFALRLTCLIFKLPRLRMLLVLDEPFKSLSMENSVKVGKLLEELAKKLKVQIILVSHNQLLRAGKVVKIGE